MAEENRTTVKMDKGDFQHLLMLILEYTDDMEKLAAVWEVLIGPAKLIDDGQWDIEVDAQAVALFNWRVLAKLRVAERKLNTR